jgi:O-methyltransferase involved in polyketide biosynthesis
MPTDTTRPSAPRIYDYLLGGTHNFEVDRVTATRLLEELPFARRSCALNRAFLHQAVLELASRRFDCYLDLATGLPTQGYLHDVAPPGARIVYNDLDADTVAYAREILGDRPNIRYLESDLREIDRLLARAAEHFGAQRRVGVCLVGVSYFIDDVALARVFERLHAWCAPGSLLAVTGMVERARTPNIEDVYATYRRMGAPLVMREPDALLRLAAPWRAPAGLQRVTAPGLDSSSDALQIIGGMLVRD